MRRRRFAPVQGDVFATNVAAIAEEVRTGDWSRIDLCPAGARALFGRGGNPYRWFSVGGVHCWGANLKGTLGIGSMKQPASGMVGGIGDGSDPVVDIDAGDYHTCALTQSRRLWCWGSNYTGQVGMGEISPADSPQRRGPGLPEPALEVSSGDYHVCARLASKRLACWGNNQRVPFLSNCQPRAIKPPTSSTGWPTSTSFTSAMYTCVT